MWLQIKRTFKSGIENFMYNIWLGIATISVIAVALFIINIQVANVVANNLLLANVQDKVNISLYLNQNINDDDGHKIEKSIKNYSEVERVTYISREEALKKFQEDVKNNQVLKDAMEEIGENPLGITLNIKAYNSDDYSSIVEKIKNSSFKDKIDKVNYEEYKGVIDGLNSEIQASRKMTIVLGIVLSAIAILITFNTIRITIYTHRKEIEIMKLVGGSNWYVMAPFIWEGVIYGAIATVIALLASYGYLYYIISDGSSGTLLSLSNAKFVRQFLEVYFMNNIGLVILGQFAGGILLGIVSSLITIRRHLKI